MPPAPPAEISGQENAARSAEKARELRERVEGLQRELGRLEGRLEFTERAESTMREERERLVRLLEEERAERWLLAFPRYGSRSDPQRRFRSMWVRSITGPLGKRSRVAHELRNDVPGSPTMTTGVPNKLLRTLAGRLRRQSAQIS